MSKDTKKYSYTHSDIEMKKYANEHAWPEQYTPLSSREQAKNASAGYGKQDYLCNVKEIDDNTIEKSKVYRKFKGEAEHWVEINYKRTRTPKL